MYDGALSCLHTVRQDSYVQTPHRFMLMPPILSQSNIALTREIQVSDELGRLSYLHIPVERDLTVYVDKRELVTLMTMGGCPELLVLGYLRNQRLLEAATQIKSIQVDWDVGAAVVVTHQGISQIDERTAKKIVTTGCGQGTVFGELLQALDEIQLPSEVQIRQTHLVSIIEQMRLHPSIYKKAGSVHACALFTNQGLLLQFVEDVGRHNAVDAIAGKMWLDESRGADKVLYTTGRLTSEMVMKGAQMGIPILMSRSGSTEMGYELAQKLGVTLLTRCTGKHFLVLTRSQAVLRDVLA